VGSGPQSSVASVTHKSCAEWRLLGLSSREWLLLGGIVTYGFLLRGCGISDTPLWADEAESSINALTILQHGTPRGEYLGVPVFENTLSQPWPDSREYEFKDTSYSRKGLVIYHGWLPLYAIASSFALHGIQPDEDQSALVPRHSTEDMRRRTRAARVPALVFGSMLLIVIFFAARELYGVDAAWAALTATTLSSTAIAFSKQARYYSVTLVLSGLCCLLLCLIVKRGRWRDFVLGGMTFTLLFHTNLFAFVTACAVTIFVVPFVRSHARIWVKGTLFAGIIAAGTVPWILYTGFIDSAIDRPMARSLLSLQDVLRYPWDRLPYVLLAIGALIWLLAVPSLRTRVPARFVDPFHTARASFFLISAWAILAFLLFNLIVPAASYFYSRLTLVVLVPSLLFGAMLFAACARAILPRHSTVLAPVLFVLVLFPAGRTTFLVPSLDPEPLFAVIDLLRDLDLPPGTRLYTESSENLILRFYTGMPFQSVMPVRKVFLDSYEGEILILESTPFEALSEQDVMGFLGGQGTAASRQQARQVRRSVSESLLREDLGARAARVSPTAEPLPSRLQPLLGYQRVVTARQVNRIVNSTGNPMFKGYDIRDYGSLWRVFFFRFVDVDAHTGANLNYADRIRTATAFLLPGGAALFRSPAEAR